MINAEYLGLTANQLAEMASKLEAENAKLRESAVLQSAIFKLRDENAKLQKLAVLQSVISKHMSTCPTTDCQSCPVNEECAESVHLEGLLGIDDKETNWLVQWRSEDATDVRAENTKLRELARLLLYGATHDAEPAEALVWSQKVDALARELGIEGES